MINILDKPIEISKAEFEEYLKLKSMEALETSLILKMEGISKKCFVEFLDLEPIDFIEDSDNQTVTFTFKKFK